MNVRIIAIAAAATIAAIGFAAPASATSLGAAGQTIAHSFTNDIDSPVVQVGKKWHGKHGKWHGKHGKWHGKWHGYGHGYGYFPTYGYPYPYGGCFKQVQVNFGGHYIWQTIKIC